MSTNIREVRAKKRATRRSCWVSLDDSTYDAYRALEREHKLAQKRAEMSNDVVVQRRVDQLAEQMVNLGEQIEDSKTEFVFESCGRERYAELLDEHPPTEQDIKDDLPFNADTFPPALIAECCIEPEGVDLEQASAIWKDWSDAECGVLFQTAIAANKALKDPPFIKPAIGGTENSERNSTTAARMESLTAIS